MTTRKQFIFALVAIQIAASALMAIAAVGFLSATLDQLIGVSNNPILGIMHDRVILRTIVSFIGIAVMVTLITIPAGMLLSRIMVAPYLRILHRFSTLAQDRLHKSDLAGIAKNERDLLEHYAATLLADMRTRRDFEKARSWKEGARMLMHELKNPLTPLKLSAQQLALTAPQASGEAGRILTALDDVEKILVMFRNLVNIEFNAKQRINVASALPALLEQMRDTGLLFTVHGETGTDELIADFEPTLVKMLMVNLINNSVEENPEGCEIHYSRTAEHLQIDVLTRDRTIAQPGMVFRAGYSSKGRNRGFGLFLAQIISEYLDLGINCANTPAGAIFSVRFRHAANAAGVDATE
jgi:signal transduction histidine kinase